MLLTTAIVDYPVGTDSAAKLEAKCLTHALLGDAVERMGQGGWLAVTLQFLRGVLGDEFALLVPVVSVVGTLDLLAADCQLTSRSATVEHSLFTNCIAHPPVIYATVATEYL